MLLFDALPKNCVMQYEYWILIVESIHTVYHLLFYNYDNEVSLW